MLYSWRYRVVPVAMEFGSLYANGSEFRIRDFDACRVRVFVQCGIDREASASRGVPDKIDDDSPTHERFATPVLCDVTKHTMLNLIPFAGARGKVARSEEHTSELQSRSDLVCRLLLEKQNEASVVRKASDQ